jgi:membrane-bound lytic murein transglycosylase B
MPAARTLQRWQKATALLPLALLSGAWTMSLTLPTSATAQGGSGNGQTARLADGTKIPDAAIEAPASVSSHGEIAPGVPTGSADKVVAGASADGIPAAALSAYQRAAQVIDAADKTCHLDWTLIAAIGRVESDHGRYGGNALDGNGISRPGIYGIPLDGTNGTQKIRDTDAGQYDDDPTFDRAVGPLQFIPSTWSVIGVDGDGDGKRNPQDIDDASLATAVYLCSGKDDLSSQAGERAAVYRYNHSNAYVSLVLSIARAYADGDFASVPTSAAGTTTMTPSYGDSVLASGTSGFTYAKGHGYRTFTTPGGASRSGGSTTTSGGSRPAAAGTTSSDPTSSAPVLGGATGSGGSGGGSGSSGGTGNPVGGAVDKVTQPVKDAVTSLPTPTPKPTPPPVVDKTLTKAQATAQCLATLPKLPPPTPAELNACITKLLS